MNKQTQTKIKQNQGMSPPKIKQRRRYPFEDMELNDHFDLLPREEESLGDVKRNVVGAMSNYGRVYKKKFQAEVVEAEGLVRVWRVK